MKRLILMAILAIATLTTARAQVDYPSSKLEWRLYPGKVITVGGETIPGYVLNVSAIANQKECIFYKDSKDGRSRKVYKPSELSAYFVENDEYRSIPYAGNIPFGKPDNHFVFVAKPGPITSFVYYTERDKQILWQKGNEQPVSNAAMFLGFKKNVLKLVGDNADLAGKIERKETGYGMLGLVTIIDEYNAWVAAKQ